MLRSRPDNQVNDFLFYERGRLVGYLPLFAFGQQEAEISGMVHPHFRRRHVFSRLLEAAMVEARRRQFERLLLIVEHTSAGGLALAHHLQATYHHSEYKMLRQSVELPLASPAHLKLQAATTADLQAMTEITAEAFDIPLEKVEWYTPQIFSRPDRLYYLLYADGQRVGKVDVILMPEESWIVGLAIRADQRGRGYGRALLSETVREILAKGQQRILLEVMTDNDRALTLYTSCGFQVTSRYDYFEYPLS